jgi:hypothetical protein
MLGKQGIKQTGMVAPFQNEIFRLAGTRQHTPTQSTQPSTSTSQHTVCR